MNGRHNLPDHLLSSSYCNMASVRQFILPKITFRNSPKMPSLDVPAALLYTAVTGDYSRKIVRSLRGAVTLACHCAKR